MTRGGVWQCPPAVVRKIWGIGIQCQPKKVVKAITVDDQHTNFISKLKPKVKIIQGWIMAPLGTINYQQNKETTNSEKYDIT